MVYLAEALRVIIAYDSKGKECDARCGFNWSSTEIAGLARKRVREKFGEQVNLEIVDLSSPAASTLAIKPGDNLMQPVLLIGDKPRISGPFDLRQLLDAIETELEVRNERL